MPYRRRLSLEPLEERALLDGLGTLDDPATLTLSIADGSISEGAGAGATTATVTRNDADLSSPLVVRVTSLDDTEVIPEVTEVTIDAGEASATFDLAAVDDVTLDGTQTAVLVASEVGDPPLVTFDDTFGTSGIVTTDLLDGPNAVPVVRVQEDGKVVAVGRSPIAASTWTVIRLNPDGTPDNGFGTGGAVTTTFTGVSGTAFAPRAVDVVADGRIVVVGGAFGADSGALAARYNTDGTPDTTFGVGGQVNLQVPSAMLAMDVLPNADGSMFVFGHTRFATNTDEDVYLAKVATNGSVEFTQTFDTDRSIRMYDLAVQADGQLVAAGESIGGGDVEFLVARFNPSDGSPDTTFSDDGYIVFGIEGSSYDAEAFRLAVQPDGKIVVGGVQVRLPHVWAAARLNTDGTLDTGFDGDGTTTIPIDSNLALGGRPLDVDILLEPDGRIVMTGVSWDESSVDCRSFARLNADGSPDFSFGFGGTQVIDTGAGAALSGATLQDDGKLVTLAGDSSGAISVERFLVPPATRAATQTIEVTDDDVAGFTITESDGGTVVSETGTTDAFEVVLDVQPLSNVVISVVPGDAGEATVDKSSLTFTPNNWNAAQTVTVTGVDDSDRDGDQITSVTLSIDDSRSNDGFDPLPDQFVSVTALDDESQPGEIRGVKWKDLDFDGVWDDGEPGMEGVTVYLDLDGDGQLGAGEPSTVTGVDGTYAFTDLPAGVYTVAEVTPPGWVQTFPAMEPPPLQRISIASDGIQGDGQSSNPSISADGRFVAFDSWATNLVPGDTNEVADVFVHDRATGITERVSVASDGTEGNDYSFGPSISADGRFVTFASDASNLVAADTNQTYDVFVHDRQTGVTERVSVASGATQADRSSTSPSISADGRFVVFTSQATNLDQVDSDGVSDIFLHDRLTGVTKCVSLASDGTKGDRSSLHPEINADAGFVAFQSVATNLVPSDTNDEYDVFVRDVVNGTTQRVSIAADGTQGDDRSYVSAISADGRFVVFTSMATNLVAGGTNGELHVFLHDRQSAVTEHISVASDGTHAAGTSFAGTVDAEGRFVTFQSLASNLSPDDGFGADIDIFLRDRLRGTTTRVSVTSDTEPDAATPVVSTDGRFVAFATATANGVPDDTNRRMDVFVATNVDAWLPGTHSVAVVTGQIEQSVDFGNARASLDVDLDGEADALSDGVLILRYLFGFTGEAMVEDALEPDATRTSPADIGDYLATCRNTLLDVDANGDADALTDGIVILRYLFGFTGDPLVEDALAPNATRTDAGEIASFFDSLAPNALAPLSTVGREGKVQTASGPRILQGGEIRGTVWDDLGGDGVRGEGEEGLAGVTVFVDLDENGRLDGGEPSTVTSEDDPATTDIDEAGAYRFDGLPAGTYAVAQIAPDPYEQTSPIGLAGGSGELTFLDYVDDTFPGVDGLRGAYGLAVSPDGRHVYVAGTSDNALAVFGRNRVTGALTFVETVRDDGLRGPSSVIVSPDGRHVYATSRGPDAVVVFARDASTGRLSFQQSIEDRVFQPMAIAISPEGTHLYVASSADASLVIFRRDATTGWLEFAGRMQDGVGGVEGLYWPESAAVSPDGAHVYVGTYVDTLVTFSRDPETGGLTFVGRIKDGEGTVSGLDRVPSLALSADGRHLFATGFRANALVVFQRDATTGDLTFLEKYEQGVAGVEGLTGAGWVAVSPDGQSVYVSGYSDSAVAVFRRDVVSGQLQYLHSVQDGVGGVEGLYHTTAVTVSPDAGHVYATGWDDHAVATFRRDTLSVQAVPHIVDLAAGEVREEVDFGDWPLGGIDFGDAAGPGYPTSGAAGASHGLYAGHPRLGTLVDADDDGQPHPDGLGDDTNGVDDEDGVTFPSPIGVGQCDATVIVHVQNATDGARLDAWIDFDGDGNWGGPGERIAWRCDVAEGDNTIRFDVPTWAQPGTTLARFRISSFGGLGPSGFVEDGEVEDHAVQISAPNVTAGVLRQQAVIAGSEIPLGAYVADLDSDGDPDVIAALHDSGTILWYDNLGDGTFAQRIVSTEADNPRAVVADDLDGDGDVDVISGGASNHPTWYENDGSQNFAQHAMPDRGNGVYDLFTADLDGDGDVDVVVGDIVYANDGEESAWDLVTISFGGFEAVLAADFDGDGDLDVLSPGGWHGDWALWFENDGALNFTYHVIDQYARPSSAAAADIDADGDVDILAGEILGDELLLYENDGTGLFSKFEIYAPSDGLNSVSTCDLDGDGDWDVLASSGDDAEVVWLENRGARQFVPHHLAVGAGQGRFALPADFDLDGDLDVVAGSFDAAGIVWFESLDSLYDFGDAPETYPTRLPQGAYHELGSGLYLGASVDDENDGLADPGALGDDNDGSDDEDGVVFTSPLVAGRTATLEVTASASGLLNAWLDFNADGDWDDSGEQIFMDRPLAQGANGLSMGVPADATPADRTFARFRFNSTGGLSAGGPASDGEVEDYAVAILPLPGEIRGVVWEDLDGDGFKDEGEPGSAGWEVYLDVNENGQYDDGEPLAATGDGGEYAFSDVVPGDYLVAQRPQAGWEATYPGSGLRKVSEGADGHSWYASLSGDGRFVAFVSLASNLVPDDTNGERDVFVFDRLTGEIERVSVADDGTEGEIESNEPSISGDGRYVAFTSYAENLVPGDTNFCSDAFVYDRQTRTVKRISLTSDGSEGDWNSYSPEISYDGRFVAFYTMSALVPEDANDAWDVYAYDLQTDAIERVSVAYDQSEGDGDSFYPSISADGRFVSFTSDATNLVPNDTNDLPDIFVYDRQMQTIERVSVADDGTETDDWSYNSWLSADGRFVTFDSDATNLVPDDLNADTDVFVYDRQLQTIQRVSVSYDGSPVDGGSEFPSISGDGRYVVFDTWASNLVPGDDNEAVDVVVYDRTAGTMQLVSKADDGSQLDFGTFTATISHDGSYVGFDSTTWDMLMGYDPTIGHLFVAGGPAIAFPGTHRVSVEPGQTVAEVDFGNHLPPSLDVDGNGAADALTDGILVLRSLFGFDGGALVQGAVAQNAERTDPAAIADFLNNCRDTMLDVDANGEADALTDGILILRYLFGFTDGPLIAGALATDATRTDPGDIVDFLDQFHPGVRGTSSLAFAPLGGASVETTNPSVSAAPTGAQRVDTVLGASSRDSQDDEWLAADRVRRASLYRALAYDALQSRANFRKEQKSAHEVDLLMLRR